MWDHPSPAFIDFETQSTVDIGEHGGRLYALHPSTRILLLSVCVEETFFVWLPTHCNCILNPKNNCYWPRRIKPEYPVKVIQSKECPNDILAAVKNRPLVAHNAYGFDRYIWNRFIGNHVGGWLDSLYLARLSGRPGRLETLSERELGEGKDHAKKLLPILCTATVNPFGGINYPVIKPGDLEAFIRYNVGDVALMRKLWLTAFDRIKVEADVIETHNRINRRGLKLDKNLLRIIESASTYSQREALQTIKELTKGALHEDNIRSTKQVHEWLGRWGITVTDDNGKPCLRKEIVQKFIDSEYLIDANLSAATEIPPVVIQVLELRMKALRITDAKIKKAKQRIESDGRVRDVINYHIAHTGRFGSTGLNLHNLPRPDNRIDIERVLASIDYECYDNRDIYNNLRKFIPERKEGERALTVDDICSGLIRPSIIANGVFCLADYEQVEARGIAWIADEYKSLRSFAAGEDPYKKFAATVFNITIEQVTKDQRQVAKNAVLGLGYGMGPDKFRIYAALNGADLVKAGVTAEQVVNVYRDTFTNICGFKPKPNSNFRTNGIWHKLDKASKGCVENRVEAFAGKCSFRMQYEDMVLTLPSGREVYYPRARIEDVIPPYCYTLGLPLVPKATIVYDSPRGMKSLFGGLIAENIVQAHCRDLMALALVKFDKEGMFTVFHAHDEIVNEEEERKADNTLRSMIQIMSEVPDWSAGFPLSVEGFITPRFVKSPFESYKHTKFSTKMLAV